MGEDLMFFQYILSKIYRDFTTYNGETPPGHLTLDCAGEYGIWLVRLSLELEKLAFTLVRWKIWTKNVEFNFFERSYIPPRTGLSEDTKFNVKVVSTRKIPQNYLTKVKNKVMRLNLLEGGGGNIKSQKHSVVQSESRNVLKWPKYQNRT